MLQAGRAPGVARLSGQQAAYPPRPLVAFRDGIRKNSPQLAAGLNAMIAEYGLGTTFGNILEKRYLQNTNYVKDATSEAEIRSAGRSPPRRTAPFFAATGTRRTMRRSALHPLFSRCGPSRLEQRRQRDDKKE